MPGLDQLRSFYRRQREALLDEASLLKAAIEEHGEAKVLAAADVSRSVMYDRIRLLRLSPRCRKALIDGRLAPDVAAVIADRPALEQERLARRAEGLPLRDAKRLARAE